MYGTPYLSLILYYLSESPTEEPSTGAVKSAAMFHTNASNTLRLLH